jgi:sugar diacid utilization regulator
MRPGSDGAVESNGWQRDHLASLYGLFALSMTMLDGRDEADILRLAQTAVEPLGSTGVEGAFLVKDGDLVRHTDGSPAATLGLEGQIRALGDSDGPVRIANHAWAWVYALRHHGKAGGYLAIASAAEPPATELFLLKVLMQQTAAALGNAANLRHEREHARELADLNDKVESVNARLEISVAALKRRNTTHERLSAALASDNVEVGIVQALFELVGLPAVVEDPFGHLVAWAGPGRPDPYPQLDRRRHDDMIQRAERQRRPVRDRERLVAVARPRAEVLGVLAVVDPDHTAGADEVFALEQAATMLALDRTHARALAEVELRLRRDLVDDLIAGTELGSALARSEAVGHDLLAPHYVTIVQGVDKSSPESVLAAVEQSVANLNLRSLISRRGRTVVLLSAGGSPGETLYQAVSDQLHHSVGAIGISARCAVPADFPRGFQEARRALRVRQRSRNPLGMTSYEQLGMYRILDTTDSNAEVETFVQQWLGPLLAYDRKRNTDLVPTLSAYLECGGNYDETASAMLIHRSTLRYRLQRIREISERDLNDVDERLNLHIAVRAWNILEGAS